MGLFNSKDLSTETGETFYKPTDRCFYCGNVLDGDNWTFWSGNDERGVQIWMHPGCGKRLSDHLNMDWIRFKRLHPEQIFKS